MAGLVWLVLILIILVGLLQMPLLFDLIRSCSPKRAPKRLVGPILDTVVVFIMCVVFTAAFHLYFWFFLPSHLGNTDPWTETQGLYHIALFWFLFTNAVANYVCTVFTAPGTPPKVTMTPDNAMSVSIESCIPREQICLECKCMKAETTHHCSVCKQCVMYMDHHCPFVMGCVGLDNYHYFYSFIVYLWLGMWYCVYLTIPPFLHCQGLGYNDRTHIDCAQTSTASLLGPIVAFNLIGATAATVFNLLALLSDTSTMSCLILAIQQGFSVSASTMFQQLSLRNLFITHSRINIVFLSKRRYLVYFLIPPVLSAGKLLLRHLLTRKRTINFTFPKLPKKGSLTA